MRKTLGDVRREAEERVERERTWSMEPDPSPEWKAQYYGCRSHQVAHQGVCPQNVAQKGCRFFQHPWVNHLTVGQVTPAKVQVKGIASPGCHQQ
jgi:hypothetical protein